MEVPTKALLSELTWCQRFMEKASTLPILKHVLFEVDRQRLTLTGTDLEIGGITEVLIEQAKVQKKEKWAVAVPVCKLIKYLAKVDEPEVTLTTKDHWLTLTHGAAVSRTAGMSKESFPELPAFPAAQATLGHLSIAIDRTIFAVSTEVSRFTLDGALLDIDEDEARLIATDGHRLSLHPLQAKGKAKLKVLIPTKGLREAGRFEDDCSFSANDDHAFFNWGQRRIIARKVKGNFPDWERIMPKELPNHVFLPVKATLQVLDRVALYADERSHAVRFEITGADAPGGPCKLTIKASSVEEGNAEGSIPVMTEEVTGPITIGQNAVHVKDFLSRTDQQFAGFAYRDHKSAAVFTVSSWVYVLMPMRID